MTPEQEDLYWADFMRKEGEKQLSAPWVSALLEGDTRDAAHKSIKPHKRLLQQRVLRWLSLWGPMTCDEYEWRDCVSHQTASARFTELRNAGAIEDSGLRRKTRSGRQAVVWRVRG